MYANRIDTAGNIATTGELYAGLVVHHLVSVQQRFTDP